MIGFLDAVPAVVMAAAQRTQHSEQGIAGFRLRRVFDVHAGPYHRHEDMQLAAIYNDGRVLRVHILYQQIDGHETSAATKAQTEQKYEHPGAQDVFARPFDPQHVNEYAYELLQGNTIRFKTLVHDAAHADGSFTIDAQNDVVSCEYSPSVLPPYTSSGTIDQQRAEVLPDYWALTTEIHHYRGRYLIFGGGATVTITQSNFVHFADAGAAIAALNAGSI